MDEQIIISDENRTPLQEVVETLPDNIKIHFESIKQAIYLAINREWNEIKFNNLIRLIDFIFDTTPTRFVNNWVDNAAWENLWSLKVLSLALLLWLDTNQALKMFWEHWKSVQSNPDWDNHKNIRELDGWGIEWVKIYGISFSKKES